MLRSAEAALQRVHGMYNTQLFALMGFRMEFPRFSAAIQDRFLADVFADNPLSPYLNIRLKDARKRLTDAESFTAQTYYVFAIAAIEDYIRSFSRELDGLGLSTAQPAAKEETLERLCGYLGRTPEQLIGAQESVTVTYLRRRRNCYVHNRGIPNRSLCKLIAASGADLNSFWANHPRTLLPHAIDFSTEDLDMHDQRELINVLFILRVVLEQIDAALLVAFGDNMMLAEQARFETKSAGSWNGKIKDDKRVRKVIAHLRAVFRANPSDVPRFEALVR